MTKAVLMTLTLAILHFCHEIHHLSQTNCINYKCYGILVFIFCCVIIGLIAGRGA